MKTKLFFSLVSFAVLFTACAGQETEQQQEGTTKASQEPVTITIACGAVGAELDLCKASVDSWARITGHTVEVYQSPNLTNDRLGLFQQILGAKSPDIDIYQIDVIWPGILGEHFVNLYDYIPQKHADQHFTAIIDNNTNPDGELLALPAFTDAGLLYYRKDLLEKHGQSPPTTWTELKQVAEYILEQEKPSNPDLVGFVFQAKAYEGLTCDALEWIDSYGGGSIIDTATGEVTVNNPNAVQALEEAASWIGTIAPEGVLNYAEEDARGVFQSGNAVFMRNWPYAYGLGNSEDSPIKGNIGVSALPRGDTADGKNTGTLGGWNMAVSKYSKYPAIAADLVAFLTTYPRQFQSAIQGGYLSTIPELYNNPALAKFQPFHVELLDTFTSAVARPSKFTGSRYNQVSNKFWNAVHSILSKEISAEDGLAQLEEELNDIKGSGW